MSADIPATQDEQIRHLGFADAIRAGAIYYIFFGHILGMFPHAHFLRIGHIDVIGATTVGSNTCVSYLFALSGFLLMLGYVRAIAQSRAPQNITTFLRKRFLRIYPLYAAVVVLIFGAQCFEFALFHDSYRQTVEPALINMLLHLSFAFCLSPKTILIFPGPLWTMAVDVCFYLALPVGIACLYRATDGFRSDSKFRTLIYGALWIALASIAYRAVIIALWPTALVGFSEEAFALRNIFGSAPIFLAGIIYAMFFHEHAAKLRTFGARWAFIAATILFGLQTVLIARQPHSISMNILWRVFWYMQSVTAAIAAICLFQACAFTTNSLMQKFLRSKVVARLADLSYAVYLIHFPIISKIASCLPHTLGPKSSTALLLCLALPVTLATAIPLHLCIEKPFLQRKSRITS